MNTQERRQLVRAQVIDATVAKAAINQSRRKRADAAKLLRKTMAKNQFARTRQVDSISYPRQAG